MLNRHIFFLLMSCFFLSPISGISEQEYIEKYQQLIPAIFSDLNSIMTNAELHDDVANIYKIADKYIKTENVIFQINTKSKKILSGVSFGYNLEKNETYITFGIGYLDSYQKSKSIHYTILMHELRHLYDYIINHETFIASQKDIKEKYWFELDALHIESEFIMDYLFPVFEITQFEKDLVESFKSDNLNRISLIMHREGMDVFFYLNRVEDEFRNNEISKELALEKLSTSAFYYLDSYLKYGTKNDFSSYERFINLQSYNRFLFRLLPFIINSPNMTWDDFFKSYPGFKKFQNRVVKINDQHGQFHIDFCSKIIDEWEADITK